MDQDHATAALQDVARRRATRRSLRRSVPVAVAIVVVLVAAIVVAAVGPHDDASVSTAVAPTAVSTAPLYLVPAHLPPGFQLSAASSGADGPRSPSSSPAVTIPATLQSPLFLFGDPAARDPLTKPMVALITGPVGETLSASPDPGDGAVPAHTVTRNGRKIQVSSYAMWGQGQPEMIVAAVDLPTAGVVGVAGRNLRAPRLVSILATIPDLASPTASGGREGTPRLDPAWTQQVLAELGQGSALLVTGSVLALFLTGLRLPWQQLPKGATSLMYAGPMKGDSAPLVAVQVTPGARGLLLATRFWRGKSRAITVNGHQAWEFPAPVSHDRALDAAAGMPAVEWVQAGHVVRVTGVGASLAEVHAVAASLHEVSAAAWRQLEQQAQQQRGSSTTYDTGGGPLPPPGSMPGSSTIPGSPSSRAPAAPLPSTTAVGSA